VGRAGGEAKLEMDGWMNWAVVVGLSITFALIYHFQVPALSRDVKGQ
jgi:hypothetical protein